MSIPVGYRTDIVVDKFIERDSILILQIENSGSDCVKKTYDIGLRPRCPFDLQGQLQPLKGT